MERLNEGVGGIVLLVDMSGVLSGLATDGDVRRALLSGHDTQSPALDFMVRSFTSGHINDDRAKNLSRLSATVRHLPLLDNAGKPGDMLAWTELWRMPLVQPSLAGNETRYVSDCLSSGWVSSQGSYINRFEEAFSDFMGDGLAMCTSSGTTALHLALLGLEIGPGDEVIVPDLTFGATANAVVHAGAEPVFVDIDRETWTIAPAEIESAITERTKAVIPVHLYGHPCDMDPLMETCRRHNIKVIEDCAESLGAEYKGKKAGTFGDVSCFSFYANKVITTGEGGMVWCRDKKLHQRMGMFRDHGMSKEKRYWHEVAGHNYRMTNMQAAIGLAQVEQIHRFLKRRDELSQRYMQRLTGLPCIELPPHKDWAKTICWLFTLLVDTELLGLNLDTLINKLSEHGVETRNIFFPLHDQPAFRNYRALPTSISAEISYRGISLPTSNDMTVDDVDTVCDAFESVLKTSQAFARSNK